MKKIIMVSALALTSLSTPLQADVLSCVFSQECFDTDGCSDTDYNTHYEFDFDDDLATVAQSKATRTDVTDTVTGTLTRRDGHFRFRTNDLYSANAEQDLALSIEEVLTVAPNEDARLVIIMADTPLILTYAGSCVVTE
jgi:hypothetical protein